MFYAWTPDAAGKVPQTRNCSLPAARSSFAAADSRARKGAVWVALDPCRVAVETPERTALHPGALGFSRCARAAFSGIAEGPSIRGKDIGELLLPEDEAPWFGDFLLREPFRQRRSRFRTRSRARRQAREQNLCRGDRLVRLNS